jgi:hypothetical protein
MKTAQHERLRAAFHAAAIGDALGTIFDGMSRGHIQAVYKNIQSFVDPFPALKGKEERWKKPGLYTAPTQMMFLFAIASPWKKNAPQEIPALIERAASHGSGTWGIFRHSDPLLRDFIARCVQARESGLFVDGARSGVIHPSVFLPLLILPPNMQRDLNRIAIEHARFFTNDEFAIAMAVIAIHIIEHLIREPVDLPHRAECIIDIARSAVRWFQEHSAELFAIRINPESFIAKAAVCASALETLQGSRSIEDAERRICAYAAPHYPHHISRATINHPLLVFPFACAHFGLTQHSEEEMLFTAAREGGAAGILTPTAGIFAASSAGSSAIHQNLREGLINKTAITRLVDAIIEGKTSAEEIDQFITSEASLTRKEEEELSAKLRHIKQKEKKKPTKEDREKELTRHVVESWTKLDKAKWKKQKKKYQGE